ncbi:alpha/beta hydrolase [Parvibaculum sp.]|jgi:pimeloyl-ACP methyl ester carboxylesterase|uniref:alpha/beta fold hydrolase n=1 Tax=Parvibaculum sp. TaxID=2024848 RepID=UPI001B09E29F|nr:alpha/beta hydrolase [Parvibaculum sp.]MBO6635445.1 alpha/beta hydrolase [Parvibaculum sp.]MBO6678701.1 alpha/beta hydrolase [Parvibaculum sp.]MBO6683939.1 alpha/beta hydrolase [Parvibaculum sp.]MBO6906374.1 alpha/beta hydrolase [Parvibaculum sp.]
MSDAVYRSVAAAAKVEALYRRAIDAWPVPASERTIATREGPTFVLSCGPEKAPPILLLHGSMANSAAWMPDVAPWAARFRLHAVDMIGEAGFSARVRPPLEGDAHALWLDDVFAGLGLSRAALVGTSLGGWLALDYAKRRPGTVTALALISPAGIGRQKNFLLKVLPLMLLGSWGKRRMWELVFGPAQKAPPPEMQALAALMEAIGEAEKPRVLRIPALSDAELAALDMPLIAIVGGRDVLLDSRDTRARLERHAPNAEVSFIEEGYHFLPDTGPRVTGFLERNLLPG